MQFLLIRQHLKFSLLTIEKYLCSVNFIWYIFRSVDFSLLYHIIFSWLSVHQIFFMIFSAGMSRIMWKVGWMCFVFLPRRILCFPGIQLQWPGNLLQLLFIWWLHWWWAGAIDGGWLMSCRSYFWSSFIRCGTNRVMSTHLENRLEILFPFD